MPLTEALRTLAGQAALQIIRDGKSRAAASSRADLSLTEDSPDTSTEFAADRHTELLAQASKGIVLLDAHNAALEAVARDRGAWADSEIKRFDDEAAHWQRRAEQLEQRTREIEARTEPMKRRAESAERLAREQGAALATLREGIVAALGPGSHAADALSIIEGSPIPDR